MRPPSDWANLIAGRRRANDLDSGLRADSRRRLGGHSQARQFLVSDNGAAAAPKGVWRGLVSALQRHAVENALIEMSPEDKEVLTLAYLQGQTNNEIAARLRVSASTARRRLSVALARLEEQARRSGAWISAIATAGILEISQRVARLGRIAGGIRYGDWATGIAGGLAAGAFAAVGVGLLVADHGASTIEHNRAPATAQVGGLAHTTGEFARSPSVGFPLEPVQTGVAAGQPAALTGRDASALQGPSGQKSREAVEGCLGNPTSAPPPVPVGPPAGHPTGAPVTHPSAGGCDKD